MGIRAWIDGPWLLKQQPMLVKNIADFDPVLLPTTHSITSSYHVVSLGVFAAPTLQSKLEPSSLMSNVSECELWLWPRAAYPGGASQRHTCLGLPCLGLACL